MNGEEMPDGLEYPDQILFLCFRSLYAQLRNGDISRELAISEKRKLLHEHKAYRRVDEMGKEWIRILGETEAACAAYRKERTLENADKLLAAVEGSKYVK